MNFHFKVFPILILLAGCASTGIVKRPANPVDALRYDIDRVLADSVFIPTRAAIKIVSLDRGDTLYERDSKILMRPASNMKLLTTSAALKILGTDHSFRTTISADSLSPDGTVNGNLYLKGTGDPDLRTEDLDTLSQQLKAIGIKKVLGNIVADASYFDDLSWGEGWMWDDEPYSFQAAISALSVNKNCVKVSVIPGRWPGDAVQASFEPHTSYVTLLNTARTVADTAIEPLKITRLFKDRLNIIVVQGEIVAKPDTVEEDITVWRPELYAATLLYEILQKDSISIGGRPTIGITPPSTFELAVRRWPIDTMMVNLNKESDNLSAENTLKSISVMRGGIPGSARHGLSYVKEVMASFGIDTTSFYVVDGSGVSHYNLVTADILVKILKAMAQEPDIFPLLYRSLPIAGVDGTLKTRMRNTPAAGNLRAKTGSIGGVSSLSGYVTTRDNERLAFSMLMQNFILPTRFYRYAQDAIGVLLAGFSRGPSATASR
jgi:D-alanyl-D-alanine carboxypeptidase/D-alanyl-D-alanine-endopeptidase (penicillin-binding protein 4)